MKADRKRRDRELRTIEAMIGIYCHDQHASDGELCAECAGLAAYARQRLEKCPFQDEKPTCVKCPIHCYKPECREQVRMVMRYAGPRLLLRRPVLTIRHMIDERRATPARPRRKASERTDQGERGR